MPKAASTTTGSPDAKKLNPYQRYCRENRERIKEEFPDLNGKAINGKLSEAWWDAEENPKRGQRPTKKSKKAKDANKENTPKGTKKAKKAVTEPSSDE